MLADIALWLAAPVSWASRRSGLLARGLALRSRARRRRREWAPHLAASRAFMAQSLAGAPRGGRALVLGSGLLQDVDLDALLAHADEVVLVDAAHLPGVRLRHAGNRRLRFVERDLSGTGYYGEPARRVPPLADFAADPEVSFVYSANLLSQLPLPVTERADAPSGAGRAIVEGHLADLLAFPARVCLITDVAYAEIGPGGIGGEPVDMLEGVALPEPDAAWDWEVSPRGEEDALIAYRHRVHAFADLAAAWKRPPGAPAA